MVIAGEWKLGRTIGSGATATVYLGSSCSSGELLAVKSSPIARSALLQREQNILCSLSSPHIVSCLGSDVTADSYHLFLELAGGGTLSELSGRVSEAKIRSFTYQLLLALSYLHSNGFAHCDVKGRNVFLDSGGRVKLGDFGCARKVGGSTFSPCVMGTPAFMAPEVARGEEQGFSGDVWSLGCTVVEMATGKSPWPEATDALSTLYQIGFTSDVPIIPDWISDEAKDFVSKCLVRDPRQRWTAEQLLHHPFLATEEVSPLIHSSEKKELGVSPKSLLEFRQWEIENDGDAKEEMDVEPEIISKRIQILSSPAPADWTWSGSWMPVRIMSDEEKGRITISDEEEASPSGSDSIAAEEELEFPSSFSEEEAEYRTNQMDISCETYCIETEIEPSVHCIGFLQSAYL